MLAGTFFCMFILIMGMFLMEEGRLDQRGRYVLALCMLMGIFGVIVFIGGFYHRLERRTRGGIQKRNQVPAGGTDSGFIQNGPGGKPSAP